MSEKQVQSAAFSFKTHQIREFSYSLPKDDSEELELGVEFHPMGTYNPQQKTFTLTINFRAVYGRDEMPFANVMAVGEFEFAESIDLKNIPDYFYANSIAILFPYIRAFITTLTAVANVKPFILPTFNLTGLAEPLQKNTDVI